MWRSSFPLLKQGVASAVVRCKPASFGSRATVFIGSGNGFCGCLFSSSAGGGIGHGGNGGDGVSLAEANKLMRLVDVQAPKTKLGTGSLEEEKKLMRLVDVEALKTKLCAGGKEVIRYSELLQECETMGVTRSAEEAKELAKVLDDAGVIFIFRDKVYLHPEKVMDLVRRAVPLALTPENDPRREELKNLQAKQDQIDILAHKQVRRILWAGLGLSLGQVGLFLRLTFWEFSWDVMEPITFFTTTSGLILGYAYFLFTSSDPTYQDLMKRLFLSRRRKLMKKQKFDVERYLELQRKCKSPLDAHPSAQHQIAGVVLETQDLLHRH